MPTGAPDDHAAFAQAFPEPGRGGVVGLARRAVAHELDGGPDSGRAGSPGALAIGGSSGVGMGSCPGMRVGRQVPGLDEGRTDFDGSPFDTRPLRTGNPWFLAPSVRQYRLRDRLPVRPRDRRGARRPAPSAIAARYSAGPILSEIVPTPSIEPSMWSPATTAPTPSGVPV